MSAAGRKYAQVNSSSRVQRTTTGRPAARARRAASTAYSPWCFPPKPPPASGMMTRTFSAGTPRARETSERIPKGFWEPVQTVTASPDHSATAARVSMGTCWM
jgi:hypothetical protein